MTCNFRVLAHGISGIRQEGIEGNGEIRTLFFFLPRTKALQIACNPASLQGVDAKQGLVRDNEDVMVLNLITINI